MEDERFTPLWRRHLPALALGLLNVFLIGLGMGVPILAIALGIPVGWHLGRRASDVSREWLGGVTRRAAALAGVSALVLLVVWGPHIPTVLAPGFDAAAWGIPLILYTSRASGIGWMALMIVVSPLLQAALTVTSAVIATVAPPSVGTRG